MDVNETVEKYIPYAKERGRWWASKHPYLYEDIISAAQLALVSGLNRTVPTQNIKGYISRCIDNEVISLLRANHIIRVPESEITRRRKENIGYDDLPKVRHLTTEDDLRHSRIHPTWVYMHILDVEELLELTETERQLIKLKGEGYSLTQIGDLLGKAKSTLSEIISNIRGRYLRLLRNHPELLKPYE